MRQTTLSVALDVKPESFERLGELLDKLQGDARTTAKNGGALAEFLSPVSVLHFMSLSLFPGYDHDPLFVLEANFDGEAGHFGRNLKARSVPNCGSACAAARRRSTSARICSRR